LARQRRLALAPPSALRRLRLTMPLPRLVVAAGILGAAVLLQGCKKKESGVPAPGAPAAPAAPAAPGVMMHGRVARDGHPCEHGWHARWRDGSRSFCRTYCCHHRNRKTHRRSRRSFCRVHEDGHEVLRACAPLHEVAFLEEPAEEVPMALSASGAEDDAALEAEEEDSEETSVGPAMELAERLGALPLALACAGFLAGGVTVFLGARALQRRGAGSGDQKAPLIES